MSTASYGQLKQQQTWQNGTVSSDAISIQCSQFLLPSMIGDLLSEPSPITVDGQMAHSLRSAHPAKIVLQPESGTSDSLSSITGCTFDGAIVKIRMADATDSVTITHGTGANQISTPDGSNVVMNGVNRIYTFHRAGGRWIYEAGGGGGGSVSGNISIGDGQKLEFVGTIDSINEGFYPPCQNSCAQSIGFKQVCLDCDDNIWYKGTGTSIVAIGGPGSGGGCTDANSCFTLNKVVSGLDGTAGAAVFKGSGTNALRIYDDAQGMVVDAVTGYGTTNTPAIPREIKTITLGAGAFGVDGTLCEYNFNDVVNVLVVPVSITCDDADTSTIYLNIPMPDRWDGTNLKVWSFLHTKEADPAGDIHTDWTGYCVESLGANAGASWAAETAGQNPDPGAMDIDLDNAAIVQHDMVVTGTNGNVPLSNCTGAGKKHLWLRMQVDAAGTTADDSGAGNALDDQLFTGFQIEYGLKAFTD